MGSWCKCSKAVKAAVVSAAPCSPSSTRARPVAHQTRGQWWCCCWCPPRCWPCRCNPPRPAAEPAPGAGSRRCARSRRDWEPAAKGEMEPFTGKILPDSFTLGCSVALLDYVTLLKIMCSWRILLELFLLSIFHAKLILFNSFSSTLYLLLE